MDDRLLVAAGVDPRLPVADQAAELVRNMPLRRLPPAGQRDVESVVESRWFAGPAECHRVLGQLFRGSTSRGSCFGRTWPCLQAAGGLVAPALPVVAQSSERAGPDGQYDVTDGVVRRESAGARRSFIRLDGVASDGDDFDLLWFGDAERYLVSAGRLEVEDLFSVLRLNASRAQVERIVVRRLRFDEDVIAGVSFSEESTVPELEVRRPLELASSDSWRDPAVLIGGRADILSARRHGDELLARTQADRGVEFKVEEDRNGWRLFAWNGDYPYRTIDLHEKDGHLCLSVTLDQGIDPLAPGVRSQLAFDLRSDLVALD